jgi:hypothetical protein
MRRRTPQEKKRLSYKKDHRNVFGRDTRATRKGIPRGKATRRRRYRRKLKDQLRAVEFGIHESAQAARVRKGGWRKVPDEPLYNVVPQKLANRALLRKHPLKGWKR